MRLESRKYLRDIQQATGLAGGPPVTIGDARNGDEEKARGALT
jgi:hypothetical protein